MAADNSQNNLPLNSSCVRTRTSDDGILAIPVAGPYGTPIKLVRVHGGMETETISASASSIGAYPVLPHPDVKDHNLQRLGGSQSVPAPMVQPQGPHQWTISASYAYVHRQLVGLASPLPVPQLSFDPTSTSDDNTIPSTCWSQDVTGTFSPPKIAPQLPIYQKISG